MWYVVILFVFLISGCSNVDLERRQKYLLTHPGFTKTQQELFLQGKLWRGMSKEEVMACLGKPYSKNYTKEGDEEIWSYKYKRNYTNFRKCNFNAMLVLRFYGDRLIEWWEE